MKHKHWVAVYYSNPDSIAIFAIEKDDSAPNVRTRLILHPGSPELWSWEEPDMSAYAALIEVLSDSGELPDDVPVDDWWEIINHPKVTAYDLDNKMITNVNHPLLGGAVAAKVMRPSVGNVSDQGRWLSRAGQYSAGPEGETGGPSGLNFL